MSYFDNIHYMSQFGNMTLNFTSPISVHIISIYVLYSFIEFCFYNHCETWLLELYLLWYFNIFSHLHYTSESLCLHSVISNSRMIYDLVSPQCTNRPHQSSTGTESHSKFYTWHRRTAKITNGLYNIRNKAPWLLMKNSMLISLLIETDFLSWPLIAW